MAQNTNYGNQSANDRSATKINLNSSQDMRGGVGFQSGSTFKVFTLIQWLKSGYSPGDVVDSNQGTLPRSSWKISCSPKSRDNYRFGNLEGVGGGPMTVLDSTKMSVNGSFVRMANRLDLCDIAQTAKDMGVRRGDSKEWSYAPSMILGANNVTPLSMAVATSGLHAKVTKLCRGRRTLSSVLSLFLLCALFFVPFIYAVIEIAKNAASFDMARINDALSYVQSLDIKLPGPFEKFDMQFRSFLANLDVAGLAKQIISYLSVVGKSSAKFIVDMVLIVVFCFFAYLYGESFKRFFKKILPIQI